MSILIGWGHKWSDSQRIKFSIANSGANHWTYTKGTSLSGKKRLAKLSEAIQIAKDRGGECLSTAYHNIEKKMHWKCGNGHTFDKSFYDVKFGLSWCKFCKAPNLKEEKCRCVFEQTFNKSFPNTRGVIGGRLELDGYCEEMKLAFEYQGEHHFKLVPRFKNTNSDLEIVQLRDKRKLFLCNDLGIKLICIPYYIRNNIEIRDFIYSELSLLGINYVPVNVNFYLLIFGKLDELRQIAINRGGKLISDRYDNSNAHLKWECKDKHVWEACASSIKQGSWCPFCSGQIVTIEDMHRIAKSRGGKCLSTHYINAKTSLKWSCQLGHVFSISPTHIKSGQWCTICRKNKHGQVMGALSGREEQSN